MKILLIGINYAPELTGCGPYTTDLAEQLVKDGHQVHVITGLPHYPAWKVPQSYRRKLQSTSEIDGVLVTRLWHWVPRKYSSLGRVIYEITFGLHSLLYSLVIRSEICLVISPSLLSIFTGVWHKMRGATLKVLVQDLIGSAAEQKASDLPKLIRRYIGKTEGWLLRKADSIAVISKGFINALENYEVEKSKVHLSENYSLLEFGDIGVHSDRQVWSWQVEDKIVLYTGSLGAKQDLANLIKAAEYLKDFKNLKFVIVGDGPQRQNLTELAADLPNVTFQDLVPKKDYPALLSSADLLISHEGVISEQMSFPSKLVNYLSSGKPILVVASKESDTFEFAESNGIPTCPPKNPKLLSELIQEILREQEININWLSNTDKLRKIRQSWCLA